MRLSDLPACIGFFSFFKRKKVPHCFQVLFNFSSAEGYAFFSSNIYNLQPLQCRRLREPLLSRIASGGRNIFPTGRHCWIRTTNAKSTCHLFCSVRLCCTLVVSCRVLPCCPTESCWSNVCCAGLQHHNSIGKMYARGLWWLCFSGYLLNGWEEVLQTSNILLCFSCFTQNLLK